MNCRFTLLLLATLVVTACGGGGSPDASTTAAALAQRIASGEDHVSAAELADRLIKDQRDFELIDIRDEADYAAGHIDGARHIPLARLLIADTLASLPAGRTILIYSNGSAHAAQAALLLQMTGRNARALLGGYNYWQAWLHDPEKAGVAHMDSAERARYEAVSCYLAGDYDAGVGLPANGTEPTGRATQPADPLGLGLGLGSNEIREMELSDTVPGSDEADALGLGLGLGLGGEAAEAIRENDTQPEDANKKLLIKAEC